MHWKARAIPSRTATASNCLTHRDYFLRIQMRAMHCPLMQFHSPVSMTPVRLSLLCLVCFISLFMAFEHLF